MREPAESPPAFSNAPIAPEALPDVSAVALAPATPGYAAYAMLVSGLSALGLSAAALLAALALEPPPWPPVVALLPAGFGALRVSYRRLYARRLGWAAREHDLVYRYGVWWQRTVVMPFARIQHVETASGPLERAFGLLRLQCFTAGGSAADLVVTGLSRQTALRLRSLLLERIRDDLEQPHRAASDVDADD